MAMKIFISFASEQKEVADMISLRLRERNHDVFLSASNLAAGFSYDYRLLEAINKAELFIFLISPESISKGRYTLSELEFARAKWPHPQSHVLPVIVSPTPIARIPTYLRAITILEPRGDIVAETNAAVEKITKGRERKHFKVKIAIASIAFLLCAASAYFLSPLLFSTTQIINLCGVGVRRTDKSLVDTKPTQELAAYLEGLKAGKYVFNWGIKGEEAASQLGFSRRFGTTYGEITYHVETTRSAQIEELIAFIDSIVQEEKSIDNLILKSDVRLPAIIYLRSYQALECAFPAEIMNGPPGPEEILRHLKGAYPSFDFQPHTSAFANVYNKALFLARDRVNKNGSFSVWEIPGFLRQAILKSSQQQN
jgi:TIR domain